MINVLDNGNKHEVMKYIKNVGIYLRRSRGDLEKDLEKHADTIYNFVHEKRWKYVEYKEIGSGSSISERAEIKYLLRDIKEELFDAIVVFDWDRLSRGSASDLEKIQGVLRLSGTLVITMNPFNIYDVNNESDEEILDMKSFIARREYKMITKRMQAGKKIGARMGNFVYGHPNFGYEYNKETKGLIPNKEEKLYFRKMVDDYLNGKSLNKISSELNQMNIPSPRGKKWNGNTIKNIITNEVYLGRIVSNKTSGVRLSQNPDGTKKPFKEHPKDEWIVIENCHEYLMTEDELMKIREILQDKTRHANGNGKNSLSGLVKCGVCKNTLAIQRNGEYIGFKKCSNCGQNKGGETYLVEDILRLKIKELRKLIIDNKRLRKPKNQVGDIDKKIEQLNMENEKHNKAIVRIHEAFEEGEGIYDDINEVKERIKERRNKISSNNEEISYLKKKRDSLNNTSDKNKIKSIEKLFSELEKENVPSEMNKIYKEIVHKVEWTRLKNNKINIKIYTK